MFRHDEVRVLPSKSGKITKEILRYWFRDIYFPNSGNDSILLLDALSTYRDRAEIDAEKPPDQNYQVITIPGGLTSTTQPLDVFFNRQYKTFFKSLSMHIHTYREEIKLHMRDTILKLHVLTHNQFRSPRFKDFIRYAWIKAGFIDRNVDADNDDIWFFSPKDYCFVEDELIINICSSCNVQPCSFAVRGVNSIFALRISMEKTIICIIANNLCNSSIVVNFSHQNCIRTHSRQVIIYFLIKTDF